MKTSIAQRVSLEATRADGYGAGLRL